MTEQPKKRVKESGFETDDEAKKYIKTLKKGYPTLSKGVWMLLLSNNPELSIGDIQRMCRVNKYFKALCAERVIWDKIFNRQFGHEALQQAKKEELNEPLARLVAWRRVAVYHKKNIKTLWRNLYRKRLTFLNADYINDVVTVDIYNPGIGIEITYSKQNSFIDDLGKYKKDVIISQESLFPFRGFIDTIYWNVYDVGREKTKILLRKVYYWAVVNKFSIISDTKDFEKQQKTVLMGCAVCDTPTRNYCPCGTRYCSIECQTGDWARHQFACVGGSEKRKRFDGKLFLKAAKNNDIGTVREMLEDQNADVNFYKKAGWTALMYAITDHSLNLAKFLLKRPEIDVNIQAKHWGNTALHFAIEYNNTSIAKYIFGA